MSMKTNLGIAGALALLAVSVQPASAQMFDNGGPLCSLLSIGCPPPPPPPPPPMAPEPMPAPAAPMKHKHHMHKKMKPAAAKTDDAKPDTMAK